MNNEVRKYVNMWIMKYIHNDELYNGHNFHRGFDYEVPDQLVDALGNAIKLVQDACEETDYTLHKERVEFILTGKQPWSSRSGVVRTALWNLHLILKLIEEDG